MKVFICELGHMTVEEAPGMNAFISSIGETIDIL